MLVYVVLMIMARISTSNFQMIETSGTGAEKTINSNSTILPSETSSTPINGSLLKAPIVGRNESSNANGQSQRPPTVGFEFPRPSIGLPQMIEKAKKFARKYLNESEIQQLKSIIAAKRNTGASQIQIRRVVLKFLNSVLNEGEKHEISSRKSQLEMDFGDSAINE